jgi:hypothetical protein
MLRASVGLALAVLLNDLANAWLPLRAAPSYDKDRARSALSVRTAASSAPSKDWVPGTSVRLKDSGLTGTLVQKAGGWWSVQLADDKQVASRASNLEEATALQKLPDDVPPQQVRSQCICHKPDSWPARSLC